jgi:3-(3-hydroxy-phenyl)propionate hydroxylase
MSSPFHDGSSVPVVIVGAGPVGVAAATMLALRGVQVLVIERHSDLYPLPRAVHLDDEIYRVLQDIGVADEFAAVTQPTLGLRLVDGRLRTMAEFSRGEPIGPHGYPPANMFDQPELERILRERLAKLPLAVLESSTEFLGLVVDPDSAGGHVEVRLRDLTTGAERTVRAGALLGCDGANSLVRDLMGSTYEDLRFEERWLVVDVRCDQPLAAWQGVQQLCDPRRAGTYMQVGPGRYRWEFRLHDDETVDSVVDSGVFEQLLLPWLGDVPFEQLEILRRAEYNFRARIADRWRQGRIFLLGDAAHLTPPFIGQGLCAGLRDAANLTWKLAAVLEGQADESLLETYEPERVPHARALVLKARTVGWAMTGGQDGAAHLRRAALAVVCRIPGATKKVLDTNPIRFPDGLSVERTGRRDSVTGGQIPQPHVLVGGERLRLDEVLGDQYSVMVVGQPDPRLVTTCTDLGFALVRVVPASADIGVHPWYSVVVDEGSLLAWFWRARTSAVLVRPDHVVQLREPLSRSDHGPGALLAEGIRAWAEELAWRPPRDAEAAETAARA